MKIVFMGTPDFAAVSLREMIRAGRAPCCVYTQPDKPRGRKMELAFSDVKKEALAAGIPVRQPESLRTRQAAEELADLNPDLIVVVAYGKLLPQNVLDIPPLGCINLHGSLLPAYRGAAPIQWSVINGEAEVGATTMYMAEKLDAGDMILKTRLTIGPDETAGQLFDRLAMEGAMLLLETIRQIEGGTAPRVPQDESQATWAPSLGKGDTPLDFSLTAQKVHNRVRGLNPWPCAKAQADGAEVKILKTRITEGTGQPGDVLDDKRLIVACGEGAVEITEIQRAGKRPVTGEEFMRGYRPRHFSDGKGT